MSNSSEIERNIAANDRRRATGNKLVHAPVRHLGGGIFEQAVLTGPNSYEYPSDRVTFHVPWPEDTRWRALPHGDSLFSEAFFGVRPQPVVCKNTLGTEIGSHGTLAPSERAKYLERIKDACPECGGRWVEHGGGRRSRKHHDGCSVGR